MESTLTVRRMYDYFIQEHPELLSEVKYEFYLKYFKDNYNFRFGRPQVDVCGQCEELGTKLKSKTLNDSAKRVAAAELLIHKRRGKKFYSKMREVTELCKGSKDKAAIVFDYMQNIPLPKTPVQEMFYYRKLWHYVFCIHDISRDKSTFYTYHEGLAKKGPNEVCTFIAHYIETFMPPEVKELYVFSDACGGQNRNHTLIRMLLTLTISGRFKIIHQYFPVRGHSFLPCDRNFATVKRNMRSQDRIYATEKYDELISMAQKAGNPFVVYQVQNDEILDFKQWWPSFFKKIPKAVNSSIQFSISKYRHLIYKADCKGYIVASEFIDGLVKDSFRMLKVNGNIPLPTAKAYTSVVPINEKKLADLRKLLPYIPDENKPFYKKMIDWPTTKRDLNDDED